MWADLEEHSHSFEPASWESAIRAALSGLAICAVILAAFAFAGTPAVF